MDLTPRFTVLLLRGRGAAPTAQSPGPEGKGRGEAVRPEGIAGATGPRRPPRKAQRGRAAERGTRGALQPAMGGLCPPLGPDRGGTHRLLPLRPAASPAGAAPSLLAEAASGAPGSAPAGPGAQRCRSGREQTRPVFCSAGPGKRPGVAWRPPEPGVPVCSRRGTAEPKRRAPSPPAAVASLAPSPRATVGLPEGRQGPPLSAAGGGGGVPLLLSRFRGLRSGQASLTRRGAASWGRTTNPSVPRGAAPGRSAAAGGRTAFWDA